MRYFRDASIHQKLIAVTLLVAGLVVFGVGAVFLYGDIALIRRSMVERVRAQAGLLAAQSTAALDFDNAAAAQEVLASLREEPLVVGATLYTAKGKVFAQYARAGDEPIAPEPRYEEALVTTEAGDLDTFVPVARHGQRLGILVLRASMDELREQIWRNVRLTAFVLLASLLLCTLLSAALQRTISGPIQRLAEVARDVTERGDYSVRAPKTTGDEVGTLCDGFNAMLGQVQRRDRELEQYRTHLEELVEVRTRDLEQKTREAQAASVAKSEFLANMSHEIRTPMNGIVGLTQVVMQSPLSPDQREHLRLILESGDALTRIINDVLDFSKIEAGRLTLDPVEFDLRDYLADSLRPHAIQTHAKNLELALHVAINVPHALVGDTLRLQQVIHNLVGNAVKFTSRGEIVVRVRRAEEPVAGRVGLSVLLEFSVADTGIGIARDKQQLIFDPFTQADGSTTRRFGGSGLGLTISARIVELLGGRLWVESEPDRGSTFHFTARFDVSARPTAGPKSGPLPRLADLTVLVVDDHPTNLLILGEMLTAWGMKPELVASPSDALLRLDALAARQGEFPTVFLLDGKMPGMDGVALADEMRRRYGLADATIVMLTSDDRGDPRHFKDAGIAACLVKPIKQSFLYNAIVELIDSTQRRKLGSSARIAIPRPEPKAPPAAAAKLHILVVEDNFINQQVAQFLLSAMGHRVSIAGDGTAAIAWLANHRCDVAFMDLQMPEMGGLEATARVREQERATGDHLPIVALTAHAVQGDRDKCLAGGMDHYLAKPVQEDELARVLTDIWPLIEAYRRDAADSILTASD